MFHVLLCSILCPSLVIGNRLYREERELVALLCLPSWCLVHCYSSVALPHVAMGWYFLIIFTYYYILLISTDLSSSKVARV